MTKNEHTEIPCYSNGSNSVNRNNLQHCDSNYHENCDNHALCHRPLRLWSFKYVIAGTSKFVGQALVQASTLKEAECILGKDSRFNGFQDRIKITCIEEILPNNEPILLQEDSVAILDRAVLKSYPFVLKSDIDKLFKDLHDEVIVIKNTLVSPTLTETKTEDGYDITIKDADGEREISIKNGENGEKGDDGKDGIDGKDGKDGINGSTFTPNVDENGIITWTNDGGLENPQSVNIKGVKGDNGITPHIGVNGNWYIGDTDTGVPSQAHFIDDTVTTTSKTWSSSKIQQKLDSIDLANFKVVDELPTQNINTNAIYLVPKDDGEGNNIRDEYVYINDSWELIGDTSVKLDGMFKQVDLTTYQGTETGEIVQHVGATTQDYTHGYIYEFTQGDTTTREYTTLVQLEAKDYEAGQLLRDGIDKTYTEIFNEYFPQGINTKVYRTDITVPVYYGDHNRYLFDNHKENGDLIIEDNTLYKIYKTEESDGTTYYIGSNAAVDFDGQADLEANATPTQVSVYQVGEGKYITDKLDGAGGIILFDETLAPIAAVEGYTQARYDGEEYAEWETETITTPSSWTRIDVQPTPLIETDRIESTNKLQSVIATDDNIQAGHYPDTTANNAALLLGNGTSSTPHNALTVDWNGNLTASGNVTDGQGNKLSDLPTKATLGDVLVDGKVVLWNAATQSLVTATTDQLRNLLMWIGTEAELRTLQQNDSLEEGKLYATLDNTYFS